MYLYFAITGIINTVVSIILGLVIFLNNPKQQINKTFAFFCLCVASWSFGYIFWPLVKDKEVVLFWFQILHIGATYASVAYLHFVSSWLEIFEKQKKVIYIGYVLASIIVLTIFSPYFISDMVPKFQMRLWAVPGAIYPFYLVLFFGYFLYSTYLLIVNLKKLDKRKQIQTKYILIGLVMAYIGGSTNYFLWYNINFPPYLNILVTGYVIATAYAIIAYRLFDIKVILAEMWASLLAILIFIWLMINFSIGNLIAFLFILSVCILFIRTAISDSKKSRYLEKVNIQLRKNKEQLIKIDQMKNEFIQMATHELSTPISVIQGKLNMAIEENFCILNKKQKDYFKPVLISTERLANLSRDILDVTKIDQHHFEINKTKSDLCDLVSSVIDELKNKFKEKNNKIEFSKNNNIPKILYDECKIRKVIYNYLNNANKFTKNGEIKISLFIQNKKIIFSVSDTGIGIEKENQKHLFEKFYQAGRFDKNNPIEQQGTGLGLYLSKCIIELHKGNIWVESKKDEGSTFYFSLPI